MCGEGGGGGGVRGEGGKPQMDAELPLNRCRSTTTCNQDDLGGGGDWEHMVVFDQVGRH